MADIPQTARRPRPLSPHMTIYHWPVNMAVSITHRATGIALSAGTVLIALWLLSVSSGLDSGSYQLFNSLVATPLGQVVLFGFVWSLAYHFLAGIRHLVWDLGYGFSVQFASRVSVGIIVLSIAIAVGAFAAAYLGKGGYLQ
jgi:succinate dehydrogenase / fumarate reductase cytochrome b subunit